MDRLVERSEPHMESTSQSKGSLKNLERVSSRVGVPLNSDRQAPGFGRVLGTPVTMGASGGSLAAVG